MTINPASTYCTLALLIDEDLLRRFLITEYLPSVFPSIRHTRLLLPYSGSLGLNRSPPYRSSQQQYEHRYYDPLRLPIALPEVLRFSLVPQYLFTRIELFVFPKARLQARYSNYKRQVFFYTGVTLSGVWYRIQSDLSSSPVTPLSTCPGLRSRWCRTHLPKRI